MAVTKAAGLLGGSRVAHVPEGLGYKLKRRLLGPPLVNEQLSEERLSKPLALGVLSPDGISSSAYGSEEILIELLRGGLGIAAFTLLLPLTGVVLFVLALVVLSYREVVSVYTRTGGSYVVARENFGPRVAQIAAVALLIDYTVTVAVQTAAGAAAIVSAFPSLSRLPVIGPKILLIISVIAILVMCFGNLRGIREAGRVFALPTYLFSGSVILMIIIGLIREATGNLPVVDPANLHGTFYTSQHTALAFNLVLVFVLLKAFANGGSSLTGIEAVSNAVSAFRPPEGVNARRVLVIQGVILAVLIAGISWLAHVTHATPYTGGTPTVISQVANLAFGGGFGRVLFYFVQAATALILFTGGNTSFNGFPFLASFVAEDAFLPRWLTKRGHRLVFSNGIIVLTVVSLALIVTVGATVNNLVPFYAIGVFTGFSLAGFGMARYHKRLKEPGWRRRRIINFSAGLLSALVVLIFAVTKFTEGAWLVVIIGPVLVFVLIRLNREYRLESGVLETISGRQPPPPPHYSRRTVLVFVDSFDLATLAALRYARSLRPTSLRAVHFVIDSARADKLRREWSRADRGGHDHSLRRAEPAGGRARARGRTGRRARARRPAGRCGRRRRGHGRPGERRRGERRSFAQRRGGGRRGGRWLGVRRSAARRRDTARRPAARVPASPGARSRCARGRRRLPAAGAAGGFGPHRQPHQARPGHRRGPGAQRGDPARRGEQRVRPDGGRLDRRADRAVLRPLAHRRRRAGRADPAHRCVRHPRRSPGNDQPELRAAVPGMTPGGTGRAAGAVTRRCRCLRAGCGPLARQALPRAAHRWD